MHRDDFIACSDDASGRASLWQILDTATPPWQSVKEGLHKWQRPMLADVEATSDDTVMKQHGLGLGMTGKRTRRRQFLDEIERVVPWMELVALVSPYLPEGKRGRPPFSPEILLRIHFMQQWFNLSDPGMEEALHDVPLFREFVGLEGWSEVTRREHDPAFSACDRASQARS